MPKYLGIFSFSLFLVVFAIPVQADEIKLKSEQEIEKSLFPDEAETEVQTRGIVPVSLGEGVDGLSSDDTDTTVAGKVDLQAITFEFNSAVLTQTAKDQLAKVATVLHTKDLIVYSFELVGHTDATGSEAYNLALSKRRAQSAARYLFEEQNIPAGSFTIYGVGEAQLANKEAPYAGENRRVEIIRRF